MTNLEDIDELLIDFYVKVINSFIGGEPAIEVFNYDIDKKLSSFWIDYIEITRDENVSDYTGKKEIRFMDHKLIEYDLTNDDILAKDWILFKRKGKRNED